MLRHLLPPVFTLTLTLLPVAAQVETTSDATVGTTAEAPAEEPKPRADLGEANALVGAGSYAEAEALLATMQEEFPEDVRLLLMRGELLLALQRHGEALPLLRRCAELDPERKRVQFQLATALQMSGERDAAIEAYGKEIAINDDLKVHVLARLNRSLLMGQGNDWNAAAMELESVVALDPDQLQAYGDMASLYLRADKLDEAARSLERGLDQGFRSARHYYSLGARFYEREAYETAVEMLEQALAIDPVLAEAERTLAGALDQLGREDDALRHLRRYLELKPNAPDAERVSERIRSIESN